MKTIKKGILAAAVAAGLAFSLPASAGGLPVFDGAAVAQAIQQGIQLKEQIENQIKQLSELKAQVKALSGARNLGTILKTEALEQLPDEWKSVYSQLKGFKDGNYKDLLSSKGYNSAADAERLVQNYDLLLKAIKDSKVRMDNINKLMEVANQTQDAKASADLMNRIGLEQARIQQNQTNLDTMARLMDLNEKIQAKQRRARDNCIRQNRIDGTSKSCV